jgi:hypothetical protein
MKTQIRSSRRREAKAQAWLIVFMWIALLGLTAKNAAGASSPTLVSITVTPATLTAPIGSSQQFKAIATYSDGSTQDITSQVTWASSNTSVATVSSGGLATVQAVGTASISAGISATATMTSQMPAAPAPTTPVAGSTPSRLPSGLILHWTFDNATISGNTVADTSGNNQTGTIQGSVAVVTGILGQALQFNGSNSAVTSYSGAPFNTNLTLSAWINTTNSVRAEAILSRYDASGAGAGYIFRTDAGGHLEVVLGGYNGGSINSPSVDTATVNDGRWHQVAAVLTAGQGVQFYVDGNPTATIPGRITVADGGTFHVGVNPYTPFGAYFTGTIDEVQVYNRALSSTEMATVYSLSGGSQSPNPVSSTTPATTQTQTASIPTQPAANPGVLAANPASLAFGSVNVGSTSSQSISISNTGSSNVTVSNVSVSGAGFNATGLPVGTVLTPGQSATVNVTFTPGGATAVTGGFTVTSNATDSTDTIAFSGTGTQPAPTVYSVNLSWAPSSTPGITGYDLYRGTVMGGPYTLLTTVSPTSESYVDATAQTGQTYYYVVTSIGANGVQSSYSNVATAVVQ